MKHQIEERKRKGCGGVRFRPPCPAPIKACLDSEKGKCCFECKKKGTCPNACLNDPKKCGLWDNGYREGNSK